MLFLLWTLNHLHELPHVHILNAAFGEVVQMAVSASGVVRSQCKLLPAAVECSCGCLCSSSQACMSPYPQAQEFLDNTPDSEADLEGRFGCLLGTWTMATLCAVVVEGGSGSSSACRYLLFLLQHGLLSAWNADAGMALQHFQQQRGFQPAISAHQLHQLFLLLRCQVRLELAKQQAPGAGTRQAALAAQTDEYVQLCQVQPSSPALLVGRATALLMAGRPVEALSTSMAAQKAADATNCESGMLPVACGPSGQPALISYVPCL